MIIKIIIFLNNNNKNIRNKFVNLGKIVAKDPEKPKKLASRRNTV